MNDKELHIRIQELAEEKGISKAKLRKDLDMQFGNLNKYYNDKFQRIDAKLIIKLCEYFQCGISDLSHGRRLNHQLCWWFGSAPPDLLWFRLKAGLANLVHHVTGSRLKAALLILTFKALLPAGPSHTAL